MPESYVDQLIALAEIASVFIGFVALVSVLARDRLGIARIAAVVVTAAILLFATLLPVLLDAYGLDGTTSLRIAAIASLAVNLAGLVLQFRYVTEFTAAHRKGRRTAAVAVWTLEVPFWIALLLCAFGSTGHEPGLYLTAIVLAMFQVIVVLLAIVVDFANSEDSEDG